ncbi:MAG TPA: E3 binding domain-containing protein, partial [Opitutaceae bacterium]
YEAPCDGVIRAIHAQPGDARAAGALFLQIETSDQSLLHLKSKAGVSARQADSAPKAAAIWTPRAAKLAKEAGLDPEKINDIEASGPGGRVSGDDVARYIEKRKK